MTPLEIILFALLIITNFLWFCVTTGYMKGVWQALDEHMKDEHPDER